MTRGPCGRSLGHAVDGAEPQEVEGVLLDGRIESTDETVIQLASHHPATAAELAAGRTRRRAGQARTG